MSDVPPVLVVGLQKSGTSLLLRLLADTSAFRNPVKFEGKELWGDDPPFAPEAFPAGAFYQRDGGERGHELGAAEATDEVVAHLRSELAGFAKPGKALVLKNPYNTVRVPWLRAALPDAHIVAVVRRPLPNVFSLAKKHAENPHVHRGPEGGWWGVKPAGWQELVGDDKVAQSARQWAAVNGKLADDRDQVDRVVPYHELCAEPERFVADIAAATVGEAPETDVPAALRPGRRARARRAAGVGEQGLQATGLARPRGRRARRRAPRALHRRPAQRRPRDQRETAERLGV